jgi:TolA-binding protein
MKRSSGLPPSKQDDAEQRLVLQLVAHAYPRENNNFDDHTVSRAIARVNEKRRTAASGRKKLRLSVAMVLLGTLAGGALAAVSIPTLLKRQAAPTTPLPRNPLASPVSQALPAPATQAPEAPPPPVAKASKPRSADHATAPAITPDAAPDSGAANLFEEARRARALGWDALAAKRFEQLINEYPTSPEADVSRLAAGRLYRKLGDHTRALAAFSSYLKHNPRGPLEEEAMAGIAQSLESLGRDATPAWQALAAAHPQSPYLKGQAATP